MTDTQSLFVKMTRDAWDAHIKRTDEVFNRLTDEQMLTEIAPRKNRAIYLLGHLTAVHDRLLPMLSLGERLYPQLEEPFVTKPDKAATELPTIKELRQYWTNVNGKLNDGFSKLSANEWFEKHTSVSQEDFEKEPHRNKLNVLISRTNHLAYHYGQLKLMDQ